MTTFIILFLTILGFLEIAIRLYRHLKRDERFGSVCRMPSPKALSFKSHPYILYVKKANCDGLYPSNSMGYAGKREISKMKMQNSIRIYCVGGSTMESCDPDLGPDSSWPGRLQDILALRFPEVSVECINAATAGYTSAESLAEFIFRGVDLKPDILLVYHNLNDVWTCQMVRDFKPDYSHARRHKPWRLGWVNRIPQIPYLYVYQFLWEWITERFGKSNALIYWISDPPWKTAHRFDARAVEVFKRNIINLVSVARTWSCVPILIKWECDWTARWLPPYLENTEETVNTYFDFLCANNRALEEVALRFNDCYYLDVGPFESHHFSDTIHFSSCGLKEMARRVADGIEPIVRSILINRETEKTEADSSVPEGSITKGEKRE